MTEDTKVDSYEELLVLADRQYTCRDCGMRFAVGNELGYHVWRRHVKFRRYTVNVAELERAGFDLLDLEDESHYDYAVSFAWEDGRTTERWVSARVREVLSPLEIEESVYVEAGDDVPREVRVRISILRAIIRDIRRFVKKRRYPAIDSPQAPGWLAQELDYPIAVREYHERYVSRKVVTPPASHQKVVTPPASNRKVVTPPSDDVLWPLPPEPVPAPVPLTAMAGGDTTCQPPAGGDTTFRSGRSAGLPEHKLRARMAAEAEWQRLFHAVALERREYLLAKWAKKGGVPVPDADLGKLLFLLPKKELLAAEVNGRSLKSVVYNNFGQSPTRVALFMASRPWHRSELAGKALSAEKDRLMAEMR